MMKRIDSFEKMEKALSECVKDGFTSIPLEDCKKHLAEQRKKSEVDSRKYIVTEEQLQRRFTI